MEQNNQLKKSLWPTWRQVAGPCLTDSQMDCAGLSDRDPATKESFYVNMEARNHAALVLWRRGQRG